jgi:hypothetical protein
MKLGPADLITCNIKEKDTPPLLARTLNYDAPKVKFITGDKADSEYTLTIITFKVVFTKLCYAIDTVEQGLVLIYPQFSEYNVHCSHHK